MSILQSHQLAKSLIILATHKPPDIPRVAIPAVCILHLSALLALEDAGVIRFVTVLEWAERLSRAWRKHGSDSILKYVEVVDINSKLAPPSAMQFGSQSTPTLPGSSSSHLSVNYTPPSPGRSSSTPSSMSASFTLRRGYTSLPPPDPSQRSFDALVSFMPAGVPDKALLKHSILVPAISRPFLTSSLPASAAAARQHGG